MSLTDGSNDIVAERECSFVAEDELVSDRDVLRETAFDHVTDLERDPDGLLVMLRESLATTVKNEVLLLSDCECVCETECVQVLV